MHKIINLPFELLMRCKRDKLSLEMLACALLIKSKHQNSVLYLQVTNVMDCLGVSYKKAKKVIDRMKESELFVYNKNKNCVFAKSFKSKVMMIYGRKKYKKFRAYADGCRKVAVEKDDTLRTMKQKFREYLLIRALHANEHDHFNVGSQTSVMKKVVNRALTYRKLGAIIGLGKSSGGRFINRLIDEKRVSKSEIVAECAIEDLNEITEAEWFKEHPGQKFSAWHNPNGGWSGWLVYGFVYTLESQHDLKAMKHVIWNHAGRFTNPTDEGCGTPDGDKYWSKHS